LQKNIEDFTELIKEEHTLLLMDGRFVKDRDLNALEINAEVRWNWDDELDLIQGMDHFRFDGYLKNA
jgi:hypothetical protein